MPAFPLIRPADVRVAREAEQLVERRLAGAVIADRQLAHAEHHVDEHDVEPDAAGGRHRRHVVAAGVAEGAQPFLGEPARHRHQLRRGAHRVVGAEHADRRGHAAGGEPAERERRDPGLRAGLAAAAGEVDVPVDQAGDDPAPAEVHFLDAERAVERRDVTPDPDHPLAGHQQVAATLRRGVVQLRVPEQQQHRTVRAAHSSLNPPTAPVSRSAASARWVALDEISSVEALSCCAAAAISSAAAA